MNYSRSVSFIIIALIYVAATLLGLICFKLLFGVYPLLPSLLIADVAATTFVWLFGLLFRNVSVYDPYWSVVPPIVFTAFALYEGTFTLPTVLLLLAVWYWGIRLTANWAVTFKGLDHEDWRYTRYRDSLSPFLFHITNYFGLNMMPTLVVFMVMIPGLGVIGSDASANFWTWLGFAMCVSSATIQLVADTEIHRFRDNHPGVPCNVGLWKHGRHPNYFGEIQMWWGVWVMYVSLAGFSAHPWYVSGAVINTAMFLFISIPMMERRQLANKPEYAEYKAHTRLLI
ncbi:MAG: DUF1295 domain-containing protein [Bacteroidales bacterium]|nr:DUF1295 domain-containing protein [Bacteroidales bacterium]